MSTYYEEGDGIYGGRIACQFRKKNSEKQISMTKNHRGNRIVIEGNAYCVILVRFMRI